VPFYSQETEYFYYLKTPVKIASSDATFSYEDIALIETGEDNSKWPDQDFYDYVIIEGTIDGVEWLPIADGYDASAVTEWHVAYNEGSKGNDDMYVKHTIDLLETFSPGDEVLFRFRLYSDQLTVGWGWAIDNLYIQETPPVGFKDDLEVSNVLGAYPNPYTSKTDIRFNLTVPGTVSTKIIDINGRVVDELNLDFHTAGDHSFEWDGSTLRKGMYIMQLHTPDGTEVLKVIKE